MPSRLCVLEAVGSAVTSVPPAGQARDGPHGAGAGCGVDVGLVVDQGRGDQAEARPADDDALQFSAAAQAAAELLDDVSHRDAKLDLVQAGPVEQRVE